MKLSRIGKKTILDGKGTLIIAKNEYAISLNGFEDDPLGVQNMHILTASLGKRKQVIKTVNFIYSEEIKITKKVFTHILGGLIGVSVGAILSFLSKEV